MADDHKQTSYYNTENTSGNARNGEFYHVENGTDSQGNPGTWHDYPDGTKEFIAAPPPVQVASQSAQPITPSPAPVAAAPAPAPAAPPASSPPSNNSFGGSGNIPASSGNNPFGNRTTVGITDTNLGPQRPETGITDTNLGPQRPLTPISTTDIGKGMPPSSGSISITGGTPAAPAPSSFGGSGNIAPAGTTVTPDRPATGITDTNLGPQRPTAGISDSNLGPQRPEVSISSTDIGKGTPPIAITGGTAAPASAGNTYTVTLDDRAQGLTGVSEKTGVPLSQLEALNPQFKSNFSLIRPGDVVNLGSGSGGGTGGGGGLPAAPAASTSPTATATSVVFPKGSTYPPTDSEASRIETAVKTELSGWGGSGNEATDPAKNVIEAVSKPETDPLKINNGNRHTA